MNIDGTWHRHALDKTGLPADPKRSIELYAATDQESKMGDIPTWNACACFTRNNFLVISFRLHELEDFENELIRRLAESLSSSFSFKYGIGYQRAYSKGPVLYAVGIVSGLGFSDSDFDEADTIGRWFHELAPDGERRHLNDKLRDVYQYNLIGQSHLDSLLDQATLREAIESGQCPGEIDSLGENLWLWTIPQDDVQCAREILAPNGLLIVSSGTG